MMTTATIAPFRNEPLLTFDDHAQREAMRAAIERARLSLGKSLPLVIGGERVTGVTAMKSVNPAFPRQTVASVASASLDHALDAIEVADRAFYDWSRRSPEERAGYLLAAAERIRRDRLDWNALLVLEVGKNWREADGDTAEAIDFLEFYAREALRYATPPALTPVPGERNVLRYLPLGVGLVIPPWNFAFAIMAGMTAASIVMGNTVILKPSSDSPAIAAMFVDLLHSVGVPSGVVNFVPGAGREIGDPLVLHPKTRFISFTGSKAVGLRINELAAKQIQGQRWIKRVIAEMGGKDAIIVADDADLDAAADGIVASAFGFSGQKCSACSRLIVDASVHDQLMERVRERTLRLKMGDPADFATDIGPVINYEAMRSINAYIDTGLKEGGELLCGGSIPREDLEGYYANPTIITGCTASSTIVREEIFGPVLAVLKANNFEHALELANDSEYGLTGAVYTRNAERLKRAADEFFVGNLYLNRKCTGALVGAHPFGGFNMSGTDSKAGGYDYLALFSQAKMVSERL